MPDLSTVQLGRRLDGKVAIITGSTKGIGYAIAERFLSEGCRVVVTSRKQKNVDEAVSSLQRGLSKTSESRRIMGIACHVGKDDQRRRLVDSVVKKWGVVDILVNNAAVSPAPGGLATISESIWDKLFEINVKAGLMLLQLCLPHMSGERDANVLFVSSIAAYNPMAPLSAYGITKTALLGLTKALAEELGPQGIRSNCLAPGTVKTRFSSILWKSKNAEEMASSRTHLDRLALPHEMGGAACFLCSPDASYMTGETIVVAGGMPSAL